MEKKHSIGNFTIQAKLTFVFVLTSILILTVNIVVYLNLNNMIVKIDEIYANNISLTEMTQTLSNVHGSMTDYLKTKSTDALELYYKNAQDYSSQVEALNVITKNPDMKQMEGSIRNMSYTYLTLTDATVSAKRGRNVDKYISGYEEASRLYSYINMYVYGLNSEQFKNSSHNYESLLIALKSSETVCLTALVFVLLCDILFCILMTRSITNPLKQLSQRADEVSRGDFDVEPLEVCSEDEVGVVTRAFNQMILSIREYVRQIQERMEMENAMKQKELRMAASLKDAQLKYLQAQINPHFLFNTLNAGAQLAMMEEADKTNKYIQNMADFFRYNVKKNNENVTIAEELELIDCYIYILNVRFSGEIHFHKNIDESLTSLRIPSMVIQPLVENSVNYGIRNIDWEGHITLSLYRDGEDACISVKDNGVGISKARIDEIYSCQVEPSEVSSDSNGIGLANVIERLRLFYNREHVITILSQGDNTGCEVIIHMPITADDSAD